MPRRLGMNTSCLCPLNVREWAECEGVGCFHLFKKHFINWESGNHNGNRKEMMTLRRV